MKVIYKYELGFPYATVKTDPNAKLLKVDSQAGSLKIWTLVDPHRDVHFDQSFEFRIMATGQEFETELPYLDTAQISWTVWHVFGDMPRG